MSLRILTTYYCPDAYGFEDNNDPVNGECDLITLNQEVLNLVVKDRIFGN